MGGIETERAPLRILLVTLQAALLLMLACVSAMLVYLSFTIAPTAFDRFRASGLPEEACKRVKAGMSFQQFDQVLHEHATYNVELAEFDRNRYTYGSYAGTCQIDLTPDSNHIASVSFQAATKRK